jgi:hypothetical protein
MSMLSITAGPYTSPARLRPRAEMTLWQGAQDIVFAAE